ncbi:hypothetical protein P8F81_14530 [Kosakonia cowanii]|uniref:hypothetical protein n=1 Tax=Kosakonia cowanii TaxID=208223 RepID=UPI002DDDA12F|nr:hypothetical protein [Kosakonia cowanii]WRY57858.1 hypothetical protein P8F81_14530 [Kosakonia cowanii]
MRGSIIDESEAFEELNKRLRSWCAKSPDKARKEVGDLFIALVNSKRDRNRIYKFVFIYTKEKLSDSDYDGISKEVFDYLRDVKSSIIGHCCWESFLKLPDEPQNPDDLVAYVRGGKWKS